MDVANFRDEVFSGSSLPYVCGGSSRPGRILPYHDQEPQQDRKSQLACNMEKDQKTGTCQAVSIRVTGGIS